MSPQKNQQINRDRISQLPSEILHKIFSNSDITQVVQTCVLSTRWKNFWKATPYLNFHLDRWRHERERFLPFAINLLRLRDRSITIQTFGLIGEQMTVFRNAQELWLENIPHIEMPTLALAVSQVHLKTLHLSRVHAYSNPQIQTLDFSSPILETLIIKDFYHLGIANLRITCPRLRVLHMDNDMVGDHQTTVLTIDTPNLKSFRFKRNMYSAYIFGDLLNLETADIEIDIESMEGTRLGMLLRRFVVGISNSRSLTLSFKGYKSISVLKSVTEMTNLMHWPSVSFRNLTHLELIEIHNKDYIGAIREVLKSFPCVETFTLEKQKINCLPTMELVNWGAGLSYQSILSHPKCAELRYSEICLDLFMFIEFLFRTAKILDTVTLIVGRVMSRQQEKELIRFTEYLKSLPRVSSGARLIVTGGAQ